MPRSGSTLLQNILGQNPDFYVTPTSGVLELVYGARMNYTSSPEFKAQDTELMRKGFLNFCHNGLLGFYTAITDKPYIVDKSRGWGIHYGFLNSIYPNPKIICMVRDIRSIVASMEKRMRDNPDLHQEGVDHSKLIGTTTLKRINELLNSPPVGLAINRLYDIIHQGLDEHIHFVKFEELTKNPEKEMTKIYEYLELPNYQHDFNNVQQVTKEDDDVYGFRDLHTVKSQVKPVENYAKEILGLDAYKDIYSGYKWFYNYFNYTF